MFRSRFFPWVSVFILLFCGAPFLPGCSDDNAPRSTILVDSINENAVLNSDVYNNGSDEQMGTPDDNIPEEQIPIVVRNEPHDASLRIRDNGPFGTVIIDHYEVRYSGGATLDPYTSAVHMLVPSGGTAEAAIVVLPGSYKIIPPLSDLVVGGEISLNAEVTLFGTEEDSGDKVSAKASVAINVANWGDK